MGQKRTVESVVSDLDIQTSNPDHEVRFYLQFEMEGLAYPFVYVVTQEVWDRVSTLFYRDEDEGSPYFVSFDDRTGKPIYVQY